MRRDAVLGVGAMLLAAGLVHSLLTGYACGAVEGGFRTLGEPCTRTSECVVGLVCSSGVCRDRADGGLDGGARDAEVGDGATLDGTLADGASPSEDGALGDAASDGLDGASTDGAAAASGDASIDDAAVDDSDASDGAPMSQIEPGDAAMSAPEGASGSAEDAR
jgi:hypothetical protein